MTHFPTLRTRRLNVVLRELTMGESIAIAGIPAHRKEEETTAFLRAAVVTSSPGLEDPAHWTVQERAAAVAWYLAAILSDGPDFAIGEKARYSDYLDGENDIPTTVENVEIGELGGDRWAVRHLTGAMAESIERTLGEVAGISASAHWEVGVMGCQLVLNCEDTPDPKAAGEGAFDEWLVARMRTLLNFPQMDFLALRFLWMTGREALHHLMRVDVGVRGGLVVLPKQMKGGEAVDLPPATFLPGPAISDAAREMAVGADGDSEPDSA